MNFNKLTIFRILCIPVFVVCVLVNTIPLTIILQLEFYYYQSFMNVLDGKIARKI